ncbi:hypothetical protein QBC39DRAFT_150732 [Podospora conica]|nr:hypothetical protein QBC39DRAFT_150732 [Schizothecium conicum]
MLISRGLQALFLGSVVAATVLDRLGVPARSPQVEISQQPSRAPKEGPFLEATLLENGSRVLQKGGDEATLSEMRRIRRRLENNTSPHPRVDHCSPSDLDRTARCSDAMTANRRRQDGNALTTTTSTVTNTRTVTSRTGVPSRVATVTTTITITIVDVLRDTATATVTVTAFNRKMKRQATPGDGLTKTEFTTVFETTTVFVAPPAVGSVTIVTFSTVTVAPNARTTNFVTVTTTLTIPSGAIPPAFEPVPVPSVTTTQGTAPTSISVIPVVPVVPSSTDRQSALPSSTLQTLVPTTGSTTILTPIPTSSTTNISPSSSTTRTTSTTTPLPTSAPNASASNNGLSTVDIIGIVLGSLAGVALLIILAFLIRRSTQRRRRAQAQMRQKLTSPDPRPPRTLAMAAILPRGRPPRPPRPDNPNTVLGTNGSEMSSTASAAGNSALQGENEVRIVIKPPPAGVAKRRTQSSQLWPMPPGHRGQTFSLFVDETTTTGNTGQTTPLESGEWSIASENGSASRGTPEQRGDVGTTVYRRGEDGLEMETFSAGAGRPTTSLYEGAWDGETGGSRRHTVRSSYLGPSGTLLSPPPVWQYAQTRGWPESTIPEGPETPPDSRGRQGGEGSEAPSLPGNERRHGSIWIGRAQ